MSASNQPPRSVNFPSLLVSEDEGRDVSMPEAHEDGSSIHSWIDSDFVPSWLRPFSLDATTRFTRTPDHLLRKTEEQETGPGFCIGGTGWHFLDMPRDGDDELASFPSLKADLDALEMAFSEVQGAARLAREEGGGDFPAGTSFSAEAGFIASFVSAELGMDADEEADAHALPAESDWLAHEQARMDAAEATNETMALLDAPEVEATTDMELLPEDAVSDVLDVTPEEVVHEALRADMAPTPDAPLEDLSFDMIEDTSPAPEAVDGEIEAMIAHRMIARGFEVIGPQMAASWTVEQQELGGPPAHLLALRQAIILGDAAFVHRLAADQDLCALPVLDEDEGGDAVMLSDWDQQPPASVSDIASAVADEADAAVMLSDFEPEADRVAADMEAPVHSVVEAEQPVASVCETQVDSVSVAVSAAETMAPAGMTDADEEAWEEDFLASVQMPGSAVAAQQEQDAVAQAAIADESATNASVQDTPSVAEAVAEAVAVADVLPALDAELADKVVPVAALSDASDMEPDAVLADRVLASDVEDDEAEPDEDAFEDILLIEDDEAGRAEEPALVEPVAASPEVDASAAAPADTAASAALAFTAPAVGATFGWQPYQQGIASDLMRFGAMAAPAAFAPAATPAQAPAVQAEAVVASSVASSPVVMPAEMAGHNVAAQDGEAAAEAEQMAEEAGSGYELPSLELLIEAPQLEPDYELSEEALDQNSTALQQILRDFGVRGEIIDANPGPVVTLYEFEPAPGVKSSRVIGLADDIARSMSAISARVAVVPGRNVIGIELPNKRRDTVWLRELLASHEFTEARTKLGFGLGKTIGGEPVIADLARMPHLLVAGTTGSGKSVAINTMILSLLYQHTPEQCRLIMIDPKMLELSIYEGIPHLLTPVVTDPKKAIIALKWAVKEMEDRYRKMARLAVRNIDGFNARMAEARAKGEVITRQVQVGFDKESGEALYEEQEMDLSPLPYIVIIVDEMADLMMVAGKEIEGAIQRLAQMARAAGIHLVMATQRPSVDVITGTIKANFPTRISFQVTSKIDSRTILGEMGAETLLGQGDMLFMAGGGRIQRVHGPFVSDAEVEHVVNFLKTQGHPEYLDEVVTDEEAEGPADSDDTAVFDKGAMGEGSGDLYDQAVAIVMRDRKASTSYIQRRLQVGYNKAASLMERMENEGIVGPANHAGKREILAFSRGD